MRRGRRGAGIAHSPRPTHLRGRVRYASAVRHRDEWITGGVPFIRTTTPRPTQSAPRYPCFDGLRAIAAISVVGVHTTFVSGFTGRSGLGRYTSRLEIGVSVFFVISGFLLYRPFAVAHFRGTPAPDARRFWVRRLRRIIPAYWVAFLVVSYVLQADTVRHAWWSLPIYLGFAQIYLPNYTLTGITQAWSVCTEMTFYLTLPLWATLMGRLGAAGPSSRRRPAGPFRRHRHRPAAHPRRPVDTQLRVELAGLASLVVVGLAYRIWVLQMHTSLSTTMPNWLPGFVDLFALGMLLAVVSAYLAQTDHRPAWLWHPALPWASWALAAGAFVAVGNIRLPLIPIYQSPVGISLVRQTLYGLFALFLVLPAVFGPQDRGLLRGLLRAQPVALIGLVSYGVYLWHEAALMLFLRWTGDHLFRIPLWQLFGAVGGMALLAATASYVVVERPALRGRRRGRSAALPAPAPVPVPVPTTGTLAASR
ncbi:MAG TPA: acyltransferase [Acidimicrobiales bacterium]